MPKIVLEFSRDEIEGLGTMVMCEMWDKRRHGRIRREYLKTFTEEERTKLSGIYPKIYKWNLITGIPENVRMKMKTYNLIQRACNFFAGV